MSDSPKGRDGFQGRRTAPGFAAPDAPVRREPQPLDTAADGTSPPAPRQDPRDSRARSTSQFGDLAPAPTGAFGPAGDAPLIEVELIHEHGPSPSTGSDARTLEVWTQNHIYVVDLSMTCIEVRALGASQALPTHPFLGTRLVGGQRNLEDRFELSHPFPSPGSLAVFERREEHKRHFACTSVVERVVVRLHLVTVPERRVAPTWAEITAAFRRPS